MKPPAEPTPGRTKPARSLFRRTLRTLILLAGSAVVVLGAAAAGIFLLLQKVPQSYPASTRPIPYDTNRIALGGGLEGFDSPYLGHTGSFNGRGSSMSGAAKLQDLDAEQAMGLRWTFMSAYWSALEPDGPVNLDAGTPPAWRELDAFIVAAHHRGLHVLLQAPVVGGNAGGPPAWAGRREFGKAAPFRMDALVDFAGKLARRYAPGGTLAQREGWGSNYGVRAWEIDNEPEGYLTHWKNQAGDYAEFFTGASARIRAADPKAVIVGPALASGKRGLRWLEAALDAPALSGSPTFRALGTPFSIGPGLDVVSFHNYEGLDTALSDGPRTVTQVFDDVRAVMEECEQRAHGFTYRRKQEYWHTEGNYDFFGVLPVERRAAWRLQFFTRAFAAGIRKVAVMDADPVEQTAIRAYTRTLPNPFPIYPVTNTLAILHGSIAAFIHPDGPEPDAGRVWILWPHANSGDAAAEIPTRRPHVELLSVDGKPTRLDAAAGNVRVNLRGDPKMAPPVLVIDRPGKPE